MYQEDFLGRVSVCVIICMHLGVCSLFFFFSWELLCWISLFHRCEHTLSYTEILGCCLSYTFFINNALILSLSSLLLSLWFQSHTFCIFYERKNVHLLLSQGMWLEKISIKYKKKKKTLCHTSVNTYSNMTFLKLNPKNIYFFLSVVA